MDIDIKELHRVNNEEYNKLYETFLDAFSHYVKLIDAYPDWDDRQAAIEMVVSFYLAYDFRYGYVYSIDDEINEGLVILDSDEVDYSEERLAEANCTGDRFRAAAAGLSGEQVEFWWNLFDELDRLESTLDIPEHHIYVDFLGVGQNHQNEGRGSRLIETLKRKSEETGLPIMLFTNGERDVEFYQKHGFRILGVTKSEEYRFENTYMLYEPEEHYDR